MYSKGRRKHYWGKKYDYLSRKTAAKHTSSEGCGKKRKKGDQELFLLFVPISSVDFFSPLNDYRSQFSQLSCFILERFGLYVALHKRQMSKRQSSY